MGREVTHVVASVKLDVIFSQIRRYYLRVNQFISLVFCVGKEIERCRQKISDLIQF